MAVGAQNLHWETSGPYTGEVSAAMLADLDVKYVIIGHSERRALFGETDLTINKKLHAALDAGLRPILCVGEDLEQRELGVTLEFISYQLKAALAGVTPVSYTPLDVYKRQGWMVSSSWERISSFFCVLEKRTASIVS